MRSLIIALLLLHAASAEQAMQSRLSEEPVPPRPLHYQPERGSMVCTNGMERYNRPLYGLGGFRIDTGDTPEYLIYRAGRAACVQLGIETPCGSLLLHQAASIKAIYRNGWMEHEIQDPVLSGHALHLTCLPSSLENGMLLEISGATEDFPIRVWLIMGGADGKRGNRGGDIGCEKEPVAMFFRLSPESCQNNRIRQDSHGFHLLGKTQKTQVFLPGDAHSYSSDAVNWDSLPRMMEEKADESPRPIAVANFGLGKNPSAWVLMQANASSDPDTVFSQSDLEQQAARDKQRLADIARQVRIDTPDAYLNSAMPALNIAANAIWDDKQGAFMHGAVAWRKPLLGWRGMNAGDALGWHERTARHFDTFAVKQNTDPIPPQMPQAEPSANGSRNETALHSNGDLSHSHYDMNLLAVDAILRHLRWTGDRDYARKIWPVLQRHVNWERRLFRREFGEEKWPLQEAYCCIWASDDLAYNGGGTTHASALFQQQLIILDQIARWIGVPSLSNEWEAERIKEAMNHLLWLPDRGCYAEWKDALGLQLTHPNPASWTFYHTMDSGVPDDFQAWQMTGQVQNDLPHFPIRASGSQDNAYVIATTNWMPYTWSLNNVVLAESAHTSLGLWQAGRTDLAYPLLKGCILDSMFLGICPGNVGMTSYYDAYRSESQRDFADGIGTLSRSIVEGLFGIEPDLITGIISIRPGFPRDWEHAVMNHADFDFSFQRHGNEDQYSFHQTARNPVKLHWRLNARTSRIARITLNGQEIRWHQASEAVGQAQIEIETPALSQTQLHIFWQGHPHEPSPTLVKCSRNQVITGSLDSEEILDLRDPQHCLNEVSRKMKSWRATAIAPPGNHAFFLKLKHDDAIWWQPVSVKIIDDASDSPAFPTSWSQQINPSRISPIPIEEKFNLRVTDLFHQQYESPRPASCSLSTPFQGCGSWCHPQDQIKVNDAGLRSIARKSGDLLTLPNGLRIKTPGIPEADNIAVVSQWKRFPDHLDIPLHGTAEKVHLLMTGTAPTMQSRIKLGSILIHYEDNTETHLDLENPTTWWPLEQDYRIDDLAFNRTGPLPLRLSLTTGEFYQPDRQGGSITGGAAMVISLPLNPAKKLRSLEIRAFTNEVLIGLMGASLERSESAEKSPNSFQRKTDDQGRD